MQSRDELLEQLEETIILQVLAGGGKVGSLSMFCYLFLYVVDLGFT